MEIEAKLLIADPGTVETIRGLDAWAGYQLLPGATQSIFDTYLDTAGRPILAAGFVCRLRKKGDAFIVTLKGLGGSDRGIHRREEIEQTIVSDTPPDLWSEGPVKDAVLRMCAGKALRRLCSIRQERLVRELIEGDRRVAVQSLDAVTVGAAGDERSWWEVELELLPEGTEADLAVMRDWAVVTLGLSPSRTSKFEAAMAFAAERRARRPLAHAGRATRARTIELQAGPGLTVEEMRETLTAMGYSPRVRPARTDVFLFLDTHDGAALKKGATLRYSQAGKEWQVWRSDRLVCASPGESAALPETGDVARALDSIRPEAHWILHMRGEQSETTLRLTSAGALPLTLRIRQWTLASPRDAARPRQMVDIAVTGRDSSANLDYFVSLVADRLGCRPVTEEALARGLSVLELPVPGAPLPAALHLQPEDTMAGACRKLLAGEAWRMRACADGARRDRDPEYVHDLRVATRRARFAAKLFESTNGAQWAVSLREELGWLADLLGAARDLDVLKARSPKMNERIAADEDFRAGFAERLRLARSAAQGALVDGLSSDRFTRLLHALEEPPASMPAPVTADMPLGTFGLRCIARAFDRLARWRRRPAGRYSPANLHSLRILFKRLRYTCEFFSPVLGKGVGGLVRAFVPYQDCLGHYQDAVAAAALLARLGEQWATEGASAGTLLAVGALLQVQRETWTAERRSFDRLWVSVSSLMTRWEKLRRGETA